MENPEIDRPGDENELSMNEKFLLK